MSSTIGAATINSSIHSVNTHSKKLDETYTKIATGKNTSISHENPTDNSKVSKLISDAKSYTSLISNLNDQNTMLLVADSGISSQQSKSLKIKNLIEQSSSQDLTSIQKADLSRKIQVLAEDFDEIANQITYNDVKLLGGNLKDAKLNTGIDGYQNISLKIPSSDTSHIVNARFETGTNIKESKQVGIEFKLEDGQTLKLPSVTISHGSGTGIGQLAQKINENQNKLGLRASFDVTTEGKDAILFGVIKGLNINNVAIGDISINSPEEYKTLVTQINKKTDLTGVKASLNINKLVLESSSGRGIVVNAASGLSVLNLNSEDSENYGKLTLVNYDGYASNVLNGKDVGFNRIDSKKISFDKLSKGTLDLDDKKAMGVKGKDLYSIGNIDLNNNVFRSHLLGVLDKISTTLTNTKDHIAYIQGKILDSKNIAVNNKITTNINISNIDDIDYAKEVANSSKYEALKESASYVFSKSLSFNKKIHDILFDSLKD